MVTNIKQNISGRTVNQFDPCKKFVFSNITLSNFLINLDLFSENDNEYFVAYSDEGYS